MAKTAPRNLSCAYYGSNKVIAIKLRLRILLVARLQSYGVPGQVSLKTSKGQHYQGENADQLLEELLDLPIHISGMRYWLLGVPAPESSHQLLQVSTDGLAAQIEQQGWQLKYLAYSQQSGQRLPSQAEFSIDQVRLRAEISQWQLPAVE